MTATDGFGAEHQPHGDDLRDADDAELLRLLRAGQDDAFAELFSRHATAVRGFALRRASDIAEAEDMAAEAFFRVLQAVRRGSGPDDNVRGYLITVVRRLAAEWGGRRRDIPIADEDLRQRVDANHPEPANRADLQLISRAFSGLPRRWRAVLWQVEVEGERPAVVADRFGLSPNATAALARRARQGLRAAYLQAHLGSAVGSTGCRSVVDKLGAYTAGQVTGAEDRRVRAHLAGCSSCTTLQAELADVCAGLRRYAGSPTAPAIGATTAVHGGLGGKLAALGSRLGRFAGLGARAKLAFAAVSVAAVGGFGVAAGPLVGHLVISINADRGHGVSSPTLGRVSSGTAGASATGAVTANTPSHASVGPRRTAVSTRSRAGGGANPADQVAPVAAPSSGPAAPGTSSSGARFPGPTGGGTAPPVAPQVLSAQQASSGVTTTPDPATLTTNAAANGTRPPTAWTTSWTTDGTTVWVVVQSMPGH